MMRKKLFETLIVDQKVFPGIAMAIKRINFAVN
jgi:hypothetical protein